MSDIDDGQHDDQYSGMKPLVDVVSAKDSFRCSLTLKQIQKELKKLTDLAHQGIDIDEARFDYLLRAQEHNEEYKLWLAEEKATWRDSVYEFAEQCLERTRTFVPVNVFESSADDLVQLGLTPELAKRVLQRQCLWLVRMSKTEIASLHESDLLGRYNSSAQHMDIIETAAIYITLPDRFNGDELGRKAEWRDQVEENLRRMLQDNDNGQLPEGRLRNPAYDGLQFGPVEDVTSVRATNIISGRHSHRPRRSFMEVCKTHSILSVLKAEDPAADSSDSDAEGGPGKFQDEYEEVEDEEEAEEEVQVVDDSNPLKFGSSNALLPTFQRATSYATRDFVEESFDEGDEREETEEEVTPEVAAGESEDQADEAESAEQGDDSLDQSNVEGEGDVEVEIVEQGDEADADVASVAADEADQNSSEIVNNEAEEGSEDHALEETNAPESAEVEEEEEEMEAEAEEEVDEDAETDERKGDAGVVDNAIIDQLAQLEAEAVAEIAAAMQARSANSTNSANSPALDTDYCIVNRADGQQANDAAEPAEGAGPDPEASVEVDQDFGYEGDDLSSSSEEEEEEEEGEEEDEVDGGEEEEEQGSDGNADERDDDSAQ